MDLNKELMHYSFHATWDLKKRNIKPFKVFEAQINQHIKEETHETFLEEGLLFQSYLYMSGIDGNQNIDNTKSTECLDKVIDLLDKWKESPQKDGFLSIAYALNAWVDIDKTESRILDLQQLYYDNRNEKQKPFEATVHFIKGYSLSRLGGIRYVECIDEFRQATEKCPGNYEYLFSLALITRRFNGHEVEVKQMLCGVSEMKPNYLYAKVELASFFLKDGSTAGAVKMLEEITTTIKAENSITPENMKILGNVMKIYLQMKHNEKVKDTYKLACKYGEDYLTSIVIHQRAKLASDLEEWGDYEKYLKNALKMNPLNIPAKLQLANRTLLPANSDAVKCKFNTILSDEYAQIKTFCLILAQL